MNCFNVLSKVISKEFIYCDQNILILFEYLVIRKYLRMMNLNNGTENRR
jgi:hypothetical protein